MSAAAPSRFLPGLPSGRAVGVAILVMIAGFAVLGPVLVPGDPF